MFNLRDPFYESGRKMPDTFREVFFFLSFFLDTQSLLMEWKQADSSELIVNITAVGAYGWPRGTGKGARHH